MLHLGRKLDSGNYEAYRKGERALKKKPGATGLEANIDKQNDKTVDCWTGEKFYEALKNVRFDAVFCFDDASPPEDPASRAEIQTS